MTTVYFRQFSPKIFSKIRFKCGKVFFNLIFNSTNIFKPVDKAQGN